MFASLQILCFMHSGLLSQSLAWASSFSVKVAMLAFPNHLRLCGNMSWSPINCHSLAFLKGMLTFTMMRMQRKSATMSVTATVVAFEEETTKHPGCYPKVPSKHLYIEVFTAELSQLLL